MRVKPSIAAKPLSVGLLNGTVAATTIGKLLRRQCWSGAAATATAVLRLGRDGVAWLIDGTAVATISQVQNRRCRSCTLAATIFRRLRESRLVRLLDGAARAATTIRQPRHSGCRCGAGTATAILRCLRNDWRIWLIDGTVAAAAIPDRRGRRSYLPLAMG